MQLGNFTVQLCIVGLTVRCPLLREARSQAVQRAPTLGHHLHAGQGSESPPCSKYIAALAQMHRAGNHPRTLGVTHLHWVEKCAHMVQTLTLDPGTSRTQLPKCTSPCSPRLRTSRTSLPSSAAAACARRSALSRQLVPPSPTPAGLLAGASAAVGGGTPSPPLAKCGLSSRACSQQRRKSRAHSAAMRNGTASFHIQQRLGTLSCTYCTDRPFLAAMGSDMAS
jgi:hypothetical protein